MEFQYKSVNSNDLNELSTLRPWRAIAAIAFDWIVIFLAIATSVYFDNLFVYLVAILLIAGRMHAFGVMLHEAAHIRLVKSRKINDWIADLFLAWPLFLITVDGYRQAHLMHHRYTNTDQDPDWLIIKDTQEFTFPQKLKYGLYQILGYVFAIHSIRDIIRDMMGERLKKPIRVSKIYNPIRFAYFGAIFLGISMLGVWEGFFFYWVVPYFTFFFLFLYIRNVAEHFGSMHYGTMLGGTRTTYPYAWERLFLAPHNVNYHADHHIFPQVPFYNLRKLHKLLMSNEEFAAKVHITRGYSTGLVKECFSEFISSFRDK
jgi:fatty acid desaturase